MPQQFLLQLDVRAQASQHRRVGVAKCVPANLADSRPEGCGFQLAGQNAFLPAWAPGVAGEYPIVRRRRRSFLAEVLSVARARCDACNFHMATGA